MGKILFLFKSIIATPIIFAKRYQQTRKILQSIRDTAIIICVMTTVKFLQESELAEAIKL